MDTWNPELDTLAQHLSREYADGEMPSGALPDEFVLGGVRIPAIGGMNYVDLSRFEQKVTVGDYSRESDNLMSSWILSSWSAGLGTDEHMEGATDSNFRWANAWTRSPGQLAHNLEVERIPPAPDTPPYEDVYPLGDFRGDFYAAYGTSLQRLDSDGMTRVGTLNAPPSGAMIGVPYQDQFFIPLAAAGTAIYDGGDIEYDTGVQSVSLVEWDTRLCALTIDGGLWFFDGEEWDEPGPRRRVPRDRIPRHLVWFYDRNGSPTVVVVTDWGIWAWDTEADVLHPTQLRPPRTPDAGRAAAEWRDDALYLSFGLGVHRQTAANVISAMGIDRNDGIPIRFRGHVAAFAPEYNGLFALLQGETTIPDEAPDEPWEYERGPFEDGMTFDPTPPYSENALLVWNEAGWHVAWTSEDAGGGTGAVTTVTVGQGSGTYGVYWGAGGILWRQRQPTAFFGPRQLVQELDTHFERHAYYESGRFDAGMRGFRKIASHLEVWLREQPDIPLRGEVRVRYRTDMNPNWRTLGTVSNYGRNVLAFGVEDGFVNGEEFGWIELRTDSETFDTTQCPVIDSFVFKHIKLPLDGRSWTVQVVLDFPNDTYHGIGSQEIADHLTALTTQPRFTRMDHLGRSYRVRVAQAQGLEGTGYDLRKQGVSLSIVEVPIPGYDATVFEPSERLA